MTCREQVNAEKKKVDLEAKDCESHLVAYGFSVLISPDDLKDAENI